RLVVMDRLAPFGVMVGDRELGRRPRASLRHRFDRSLFAFANWPIDRPSSECHRTRRMFGAVQVVSSSYPPGRSPPVVTFRPRIAIMPTDRDVVEAAGLFPASAR